MEHLRDGGEIGPGTSPRGSSQCPPPFHGDLPEIWWTHKTFKTSLDFYKQPSLFKLPDSWCESPGFRLQEGNAVLTEFRGKGGIMGSIA